VSLREKTTGKKVARRRQRVCWLGCLGKRLIREVTALSTVFFFDPLRSNKREVIARARVRNEARRKAAMTFGFK